MSAISKRGDMRRHAGGRGAVLMSLLTLVALSVADRRASFPMSYLCVCLCRWLALLSIAEVAPPPTRLHTPPDANALPTQTAILQRSAQTIERTFGGNKNRFMTSHPTLDIRPRPCPPSPPPPTTRHRKTTDIPDVRFFGRTWTGKTPWSRLHMISHVMSDSCNSA